MFHNDVIVEQPADLLTLTEKYVSAATSFIEQSAGEQQLASCIKYAILFLLDAHICSHAEASTPFFLYFAFQHTHEPQFASEQFTNTTLRGPFGDSLANLDWGVGEVITALEKTGVANNTFVFFTSDNG